MPFDRFEVRPVRATRAAAAADGHRLTALGVSRQLEAFSGQPHDGDRLKERLAFAIDHGADLTTNQVDQVSGRRTWADRVT